MPDPFSILGLPPSFDLDDGRIERAYLVRAAHAHPDAGMAGGEHAMAELNDAYEALKNPESRANALLAVLGGPSKEQNNNLPNGFLMEVMETREALESAVDGGDAGTIAAGLSAARAQRAAFIAEISALFQELASPPSPEGLAALRTQLNAWRYVERLIDQVGDAPEARR